MDSTEPTAEQFDLPDPNEPVDPICLNPRSGDPVRLVRERISRNGPCFCGSGLKFKKCCIRVHADVVTVRSKGKLPSLGQNDEHPVLAQS